MTNGRYVTALHAKLPVQIVEPSPAVLKRGMEKFQGWLDKDVSKGRLTKHNAEEARERVREVVGDGLSGGSSGLGEVDLVVEVSPSLLRVRLECSGEDISCECSDRQG